MTEPNTPRDPRASGPVSDFFDAQARTWESGYEEGGGYARRFFQERFRLVLELLGPVQGLECLDVGCASGDFVAALGAGGGRVTGVDLSSRMLERAHERGRHGNWPGVRGLARASGTALPFPDSGFDRVLAVGVIEYVPDPPRFLSEIRRVLRPGGALVLTAPNPRSPAVGLELAIHRAADRIRGRKRGRFHHRRPTPRQLVELLAASGLTPGPRAYSGYLPYNVGLRLPGGAALDRGLARIARASGLSPTGATVVVRADRESP